MSDKVKDFAEKFWLNSHEARLKLTAQQIEQQIRTTRDVNGDEFFQTHEHRTLS